MFLASIRDYKLIHNGEKNYDLPISNNGKSDHDLSTTEIQYSKQRGVPQAQLLKITSSVATCALEVTDQASSHV